MNKMLESDLVRFTMGMSKNALKHSAPVAGNEY